MIITDQGREFLNEVSAQLYSITHTEHRITSAYHPQVYNIINVYLKKALDNCLIICMVVDEWLDREVQSNTLQMYSQNCQ